MLVMVLAGGCTISDGSSRAHDVVAVSPKEARESRLSEEVAAAHTSHNLLPACTDSIAHIFATQSLKAPVVGAEDYQVAGAERRAAMHEALRDLRAERFSDARDHARHAGYQVCRTNDVVVLTPRKLRSHHARIALRLNEAKPIVFEAPHPFHDRGTAEQGRALFERLSARALIVSGTYRCESAGIASGHAGHTTACGGKQPYAVSDMAHAVDSVFHQAHVSLYGMFTGATFVSLHGMAQRGVSVSNGTRRPLASAHRSPVAALTRGLRQTLDTNSRESVTTCNAHGNTHPRYRLCGTTNVQGRHANGYAGASIVEPMRASGRFVHLEQSFVVRQNIEAVGRAFEQWLAG